MKKLSKILTATVALVFLTPSVWAYVSPGASSGFVNDYAQVLTGEQKKNLEEKLTIFERNSGNEISVVIIKNLENDTIENYAVELFGEWGIGKAKQDNGALLLIAMDNREMRIEVGYGLEPQLTDIYSSRIIRETITPFFKQGDYYEGINKAIDQMIALTGGGVPEELQKTPVSPFNFDWVIFAMIGFVWLSSILARSKSWWAGGLVGLVVAVVLGFIFGFIFFGLVAAALLVPLGLLFDFLVSRAFSNSKSKGIKPPWWAGGSGGGFGGGGFSGGGGFGGFGGGMSGGGGASGRW